MKARYKKQGNFVWGMPFADGTYGIRIVRNYVRIFPLEPVFVYRKLTTKEKVQAVK